MTRAETIATVEASVMTSLRREPRLWSFTKRKGANGGIVARRAGDQLVIYSARSYASFGLRIVADRDNFFVGHEGQLHEAVGVAILHKRFEESPLLKDAMRSRIDGTVVDGRSARAMDLSES